MRPIADEPFFAEARMQQQLADCSDTYVEYTGSHRDEPIGERLEEMPVQTAWDRAGNP